MIIGSVSHRTDTGCIVSNRLLLYRGKPNTTCFTAGSVAVNGSHSQGDQWAFASLLPPCANAVWSSTTEKGKEADLYGAYCQYNSTTKRSDVDHTELPANTPHYLPFLRISIR